MKQKIIISLVFLFAFSAFALTKAEARTCLRNPSPTAAYKSTPIVFVGTVKSIQEDKVKIKRFGREQEIRTGLTAYLRVEEAFKGIAEKEGTIFTGGSGADCGFHFEVGEKYFIFAYPLTEGSENVVSRTVFGNSNAAPKKIVGAAMTTGICTLTSNLKSAQNQLEIIRAFRLGKPETKIYGTISEYVYDFDGSVTAKYVGAMSGIAVIAEGQTGKFEAKTDENGRYVIKNLPVGKYNLKFLLPPTHTTLFDFYSTTIPIELKSKEDAAEIGLTAQINATIGGAVFDSQGKPVRDDVEISLIPVESASKPPAETLSRSAYTRNGKYVFDGVKPGKYILGISAVESPARNTPYPKTFYPSGGDVAKAKTIEIAVGQTLKNIDFRLPEELGKFVVTGVVVSANGKPIAGAEIDIFDAETPNERVFGFSDDVTTDKTGRFRITGFKGRRYLIHAYKDTDYIAGEGIQSERVEVVFDETAKNVKLVLNKNGIFINQLK